MSGSKGITRRTALKAAALTGGVALTGGLVGAQTGTDSRFTIIHDSHFHGRFGDSDEPNISRYTTVIKELRAKYPNSIFVANGDDVAKSPYVSKYRGRHMIEALNYLNPDVETYGNHEFDFSVDVLAARVGESNFPWVSANLLTETGNPLPGSDHWMTISVGPYPVGLFGLCTRDVQNARHFQEAGYQWLKPVPAAQQAVDALDGSAQYIVCASHLALAGARGVAKNVPGITALVGDHAANVLNQPESYTHADGTTTYISAVGAEFPYIGRLTFDESGSLADWERINVTTDVEPDTEMEKITRRWPAARY